ncbi:hypothetical protein CWB81_11265 [Pseudoalteromonas sp. S1688]|nr:hypothetical protein CWB81_11265 [Pseudoalteromonas sp. S1688]
MIQPIAMTMIVAIVILRPIMDRHQSQVVTIAIQARYGGAIRLEAAIRVKHLAPVAKVLTGTRALTI